MTTIRQARPTLPTSTVTKITDAAAELFRVMYDIERTQKADARVRLATELQGLDLFGSGEHYSDREEYKPGEARQ